VQAKRETNVDPGHRNEQCPHRHRAENAAARTPYIASVCRRVARR
jgi:hypothetical protein